MLLFSSSDKPATLYKFVFMNELDTQFILTPKRASSKATDFVNISIPALDIQYEIRPGYGLEPLIHDTFIIVPWAAISKS